MLHIWHSIDIHYYNSFFCLLAFLLKFPTLWLEMQFRGLYLPPLWRERLSSFLTSCQVRLKSNSTRRGPTRPGGVSGQDPKVVCTSVTAPLVIWFSILSLQNMSTCCCRTSKRPSLPPGLKHIVRLLLKEKSKTYTARDKTAARRKIWESFFSIFPFSLKMRDVHSALGFENGLAPAFP